MRARSYTGRRAGFTLVEVLVAAALCMLIMMVMATAFQAGLDTFSQLKSLGDMQSRLRTAETVLRKDLQAQHLESAFGNRVSDQRLDLWVPAGQPLPPGQLAGPPVWEPPTFGFIRILQEPMPTDPITNPTGARVSVPDKLTVGTGLDADGLPTTRAVGHVLHMAVKLPADRADHIFSANVPSATVAGNLASLGLPRLAVAGATYRSQWAEVAIFLDTTNPTGFTAPNAENTSLPMYSLVRRVRLLTEPRSAATSTARVDWRTMVTADVKAQGMSVSPVPMTGTVRADTGAAIPAGYPLNDPADVTNPHNRLGGIGGFAGPLPSPAAGASPLYSGRYNVGYQPPAAFFPPTVPHVARPAALSAFDSLSAERGTHPAANATTGAAGSALGTDTLADNVISFEVRVCYDTNPFGGNDPRGNDYRYNQLADAGGSALSQQTNLPQMNQLRLNAAGTAFDYAAGSPCRVPLTALGVGHSGTADGAFDDLPPSPYGGAIGATGSVNGVGNPLFYRTGDTAASRVRVFDLWGTSLQPVATNSRAAWDAPMAFAVDAMTGAPLTAGVAANPNCLPLPIRVKAVQIKIRMYDPKNKVARQVVLIEPV